ncbi:MAG: transglycosylase SLT domain-containing protein [bacterium]
MKFFKILNYEFHFSLLDVILLSGVIVVFSFSSFNESKVASDELFPQEYKITSPIIPENPIFCDEPVPIEDFEIRERMDREFIANTYWHSSTLLWIKRANKWFPVIEPILKKNNIPDDFKYLSVIESDLSNAVSPVGATGFWQFMEATAKSYGLTINDEVDERYHVEKATEAACKYLKDSYSTFGNWTLTAASYNTGQGGVQKRLNDQKTTYFYDLLLNQETSRFVFRILAAKYILSNPQNYGYDVKEDELYKPIETYPIEVDYSITDLAGWAKNQGVSYKILKYFNPWLRQKTLTLKDGEKYTIRLPV